MNMKEKLEKANKNIEALIEWIINDIKENNKLCPLDLEDIVDCIANCSECKEKYYNDLFTKMNKEYKV